MPVRETPTFSLVKSPATCLRFLELQLGSVTFRSDGMTTLKYSARYLTKRIWHWRTSNETSSSYIFRQSVRKVIISQKWSVFAAWGRSVQKRREVKNWEWCVVKCSAVKWCEVINLGEIRVLSMSCIKVTVCRYCAECYLIIICFSLLFSNYSTVVY